MKEEQKKHWFIIYTAPRAEKQVAERIKMQGYESWVPLHKSPRVWSDRVKIVEIPLYSSYVFVHCLEQEVYKIRNIYGVARILYYNNKPAIIQDKEILAIHSFLEEAANHALMEGDEVEILCGALRKVSGKIHKVKGKYLLLYIEALNATVCVQKTSVAPTKRI